MISACGETWCQCGDCERGEHITWAREEVVEDWHGQAKGIE